MGRGALSFSSRAQSSTRDLGPTGWGSALRLLISPSATTLSAAAAATSPALAAVAAATPVAATPTSPAAVASFPVMTARSVALDLVEAIVGVGGSGVSLDRELVTLVRILEGFI